MMTKEMSTATCTDPSRNNFFAVVSAEPSRDLTNRELFDKIELMATEQTNDLQRAINASFIIQMVIIFIFFIIFGNK